jgi:hypothetical protein
MKKCLFLFSTFFIFSCSEEKIQETKSHKTENFSSFRIDPAILRDQVFQDYLVANYYHFERNQDPELINDYIEDDYLSPEEMIDIHVPFGYDSLEELNEYAIAQNERVLYLHEVYKIRDYSTSELFDIIDQGYIDLNLPGHDTSNTTLNNCEKKWKNCRRQANAVSLTMHAGCATIDVTTLPGLLCHAGALAYQYYALEDCNYQYEDCTNQ